MNTPQNSWSRRRAAVQAEADAEEQVRADAVVVEQQAELAEKSDAEILQELNLPDPDEMKAGDDFAAFMKSAVPERLRRRALRKLWLSDPILANVDGLLDYGDDFTDAACVVENIKTAYQVGRGLLKHIEEIEKQDAEDTGGEAADVEVQEEVLVLDETGPDTRDDETENGNVIGLAEPAVVENPEIVSEVEIEDESPVMVKTRMRFAFAG